MSSQIQKPLDSLILPHLPAFQAKMGNVLLERVLPLSFSCSTGMETQIVCQLGFDEIAATARHPVPFQAKVCLHIRLGDSLWKVESDSLDAMAMRPELAKWRDENGQDFSLLPSDLTLAVLEQLFATPLDSLATWLESKIIFEDTEPKEMQWQGPIPLLLTLPQHTSSQGSTHIRVYWAKEAAATFVLERLQALPMRSFGQTHAAATFPTACPLRVGTLVLTLGELASLAEGDVLLPEVWTPETPRLVLPDGEYLLCSLAGNTLQILGVDSSCPPLAEPNESNEATMTNANDCSMDNASPRDSDDILPLLENATVAAMELPVSLELGQLQIRVDSLASLTPGTVFTLDGDAANVPVMVRVNNKLVAKGRLVDVGGLPGVQIMALATDNETVQRSPA